MASAATQPATQPSGIVVSPDRPGGVYEAGETVHWKAEWFGPGNPSADATYAIRTGHQKEAVKAALTFTGNVATFDWTFEEPNSAYAIVSWGKNPTRRTNAGAIASPFKIQPATDEPADFDAFWQGQLAALKRIPPNPQLVPGDSGVPGVTYAKITLDNINGTHVQGQLARPEKGETFPAVLIPQWAGVYGLQKAWVTDRAKTGWLALNLEAHDIPIDEPADFYARLKAPGGPLENYPKIGNTDKNKSHYLRMYLSVAQAITYLKTRPDWDGKTLVVMGTSQGGQQTLMAAGLCPDDVTAALAFLPAACDTWAESIGRRSGYPFWWNNTTPETADAVHATSKYFDPVFFARRIKCPVLCSAGLKDDVAPATSVLAAFNQIKSPKRFIVLPLAAHWDEKGSQAPYGRVAYGQWLPALAKGEPPPMDVAPAK
ncbi:MAG: acetylxylan esterase [Tepidisphaeraceae bacterium]